MRTIAVLLTLALSSTAVSPAGAAPAPDNINAPRVRPYDGRSATALLLGIERSATLRSIVDRIETGDVIVYLAMHPGLKRGLAGKLTFLAARAGARYVRISLNPLLSTEMLISVVAHELQHALEVARAPSIVDESSLEEYYKHRGIRMSGHVAGFDTFAARDAGDLVRREIAGAAGARVFESAEPFDPETWHIVYRRARERFSAR